MSVLNKGAGGDGAAVPPVTLEGVMAEVSKLLDVRLSAKFDDFKKTSLGEAIKAQVEPVNSQLTTINEALGKLVAGQGGSGVAGGGDGSGANNKQQLPPEVNAQLKNLTDQLKAYGNEIQTLKTAKESAEKRAEETERFSTIRTALNGLPFVSDKSAETAFSIVSPHVRRLDDGSLVAGVNGDNFPVDAFAKDFLQKEHGYLFRTTGASGSGAHTAGSGVRMVAKADTNTIKAGMKQDDRQAVVDSITAVLQGT
jgi:hypothetical protein